VQNSCAGEGGEYHRLQTHGNARARPDANARIHGNSTLRSLHVKTFAQRVAVVTGGASGLGKAMAQRFAREGMKIVLADIEQSALDETADEFRQVGTPVLALRADVSKAADVEALAEQAIKTFGGVHILCNNAGVAPGGVIWEVSEKDWQWTLGVNVWGVIHGIRAFVPRMIAQNVEGHVVNTASVAGLLSLPGMGMYCASKHSVVTMSECLHHDLVQAGAMIKTSVLCPAYVPTSIHDSERNRPADLRDNRKKSEAELQHEERMRHAVQSGRISAEQVADLVFAAIRDEKFYILPHGKIKPSIETRMQDILLERTPTNTLDRPRV
jgi:NAD(P)-dependent dehydrogenase (short-subunit alcohol dehydrogenase family)